MPATHKSTSYKSTPIPNPFMEGGDKAYGDIVMDLMKSKNFWQRVMGIGTLVLFACALVLFFVAMSQQDVVPILVNIMPSGEASYLGEVRQTGSLVVPQEAIVFQIRRFITNIRSISIDSQVLFDNIEACYTMVTSVYEPHMTRMLRANSPFALVGKIRRTVEIESTIRITGDSYQIDWVETSVEPGGNPTSRKMRGLVTIRLLPPDPSFIRNNPLGIFIEACEWTEI